MGKRVLKTVKKKNNKPLLKKDFTSHMAVDYYTTIIGDPLCSIWSEVVYREQGKDRISQVWHAPCCLGNITDLIIISTARHPSVVRECGSKTDKEKKDHQHKTETAKQEMKWNQETGKPRKERNIRR